MKTNRPTHHSFSIWFTVLATAVATSGFTQENTSNLPPPSKSEPERIFIPIQKVSGSDSTDDADQDETDESEKEALTIAATAGGWIPEGSSGWIRNGMMIRVTVMVQGVIEHQSEPQRINHSGKIGLPHLKNVVVGEKDVEEVEKELTEGYSLYYKNPLVNVEFMGEVSDPNLSPWGYVTVLGEIKSAGPLAMPPTQALTISGAIKLAGNMTASANKGSIKIFRPHPGDKSVEVIKVDLESLAKKGRQSENVRLRAGDVIYIPERIF